MIYINITVISNKKGNIRYVWCESAIINRWGTIKCI
jgi:hypothetical protein